MAVASQLLDAMRRYHCDTPPTILASGVAHFSPAGGQEQKEKDLRAISLLPILQRISHRLATRVGAFRRESRPRGGRSIDGDELRESKTENRKPKTESATKWIQKHRRLQDHVSCEAVFNAHAFCFDHLSFVQVSRFTFQLIQNSIYRMAPLIVRSESD
jgi:hypothetical protein